MKAGFKYGLGVVVGLFFSVAVMASEPIPIEDRDAFEKQLISCITSGLKSDCIASLFSAHFDPAFKDLDNTVSYVNSSFKKDLENCSVYKVHIANKILKAGLFDNRSYVIECSDVTFFGLYIGFRRQKEKWYVYEFSLNGSDEFLRRLLDMPSMSNKAEN